MTKARTSVSIRLSLIEKLRDIVSREQSPTGRLFDSKRASRAKICDCALEVASEVASGGFHKDLIDRWAPEFQQRLLEADQNAFARGAQAAALFLGAAVGIDAERGVITITPPAALKDVGTGEINARPMVEPKSPLLH